MASIAPDLDGVVHNVNADTAAAALAIALGAERLVVLTDVEGLYRDWPASAEIIRELSASELGDADAGTVGPAWCRRWRPASGPSEGGLTRATVTDGRVPHALLLEIFTNTGIGTMVTQDGLVRLGSRVFPGRPGHPAPRVRQRRVRGPAARTRAPQSEGDAMTGTGSDAATLSRELTGLPQRQSSTAVLAAYQHAVMNTFGPPKRVFVRGEGCYVWDADGRRHLDLLSGLAVNALGHAHPTVLSAITGQIATLGHVSNFFATPAQVALADRLGAIVDPAREDDARVFFTNSGTEANEAAFKITRMTGRTKIISTEGAFHGRSMGALAITHNPKYREPFEPLPGEVIFVPYGDADALAAAVDDATAAVVLEPIQGENGVVVPPDGYLRQARRDLRRARRAAVDRRGADRDGPDRQLAGARGPGRPGRHRHGGQGAGQRVPDRRLHRPGRAAGLLGPGSHGSTFGGNPVAAIAGLAVIAVIERDGLLANATARWAAARRRRAGSRPSAGRPASAAAACCGR